MTEIEMQAQVILEILVNVPFAECASISQNFVALTTRPGLYAARHRVEGLLYIGKAQDIQQRFRGGHKALTWAIKAVVVLKMRVSMPNTLSQRFTVEEFVARYV